MCRLEGNHSLIWYQIYHQESKSYFVGDFLCLMGGGRCIHLRNTCFLRTMDILAYLLFLRYLSPSLQNHSSLPDFFVSFGDLKVLKILIEDVALTLWGVDCSLDLDFLSNYIHLLQSSGLYFFELLIGDLVLDPGHFGCRCCQLEAEFLGCWHFSGQN